MTVKNKLPIIIFLSGAFLVALSFYFINQNTVYFYTADEVLESPSKFNNKKIRLGGMVEKGSVQWVAGTLDLKFKIRGIDPHKIIHVAYKGAPPDLFKENSGVIVEGYLKAPDEFVASQLMAKHGEEYRVPHDQTKESIEELKKSIYSLSS
jgi:cytochrome c-type biogenesis protein CcmE